MPKKETVLSIEELAAELVNRGGSIICSNKCSESQIRAARRDNRFAAVDAGFGFVLRLERKPRKAVRDNKTGLFAKKEAAADKDATTVETV